jgi:hypothetical protein
LYELDEQTGERTPRTSAAVYERIAQSNGVPKAVLERVALQQVAAYFHD